MMACASDVAYHHGVTIREFRLLRGMTQEKLAALWPKTSGERGVLPRYVQDVEHGRKHIDHPGTLRYLAALLNIPLWRFGLSEYDPFDPWTLPGCGNSLYQETLDCIESLIHQTWNLRCAARLVDAGKGVAHLTNLFAHFQEHIPLPLRLERRFLLLYAQVQRLNAVTAVEQRRYDEALSIYEEMYQTARAVDDAPLLALALMSLGAELERKGEKCAALSRLEDARDASFGAGKHIIAFVHTYLARIYASVGDTARFERAIHSAMTMASGLAGSYGDGTDCVFGRMSSILSEKSYGYLELGEPRKTLEMREELEEQIRADQDSRLAVWIPLDWAKAYHMLGEIEECVSAGQTFYHRATAMCSPHATHQATLLLNALEKDGYGDARAVQAFREELEIPLC